MKGALTSSFELLGHSSPLGRYPSVVIPIGMLDGKLVAVYGTDKIPSPIAMPPTRDFIKHTPSVTKSLKRFNYSTERLFALRVTHVVAYSISDEGAFFARQLSDPNFDKTNPFARLSLAKVTADSDILRREFDRCYSHLYQHHPEFAEDWRVAEQQCIAGSTPLRPPLNVTSFKQLLTIVRSDINVSPDRVTSAITVWISQHANSIEAVVLRLYRALLSAGTDRELLDHLCDVIVRGTGFQPPTSALIYNQRKAMAGIMRAATSTVADLVTHIEGLEPH